MARLSNDVGISNFGLVILETAGDTIPPVGRLIDISQWAVCLGSLQSQIDIFKYTTFDDLNNDTIYLSGGKWCHRSGARVNVKLRLPA